MSICLCSRVWLVCMHGYGGSGWSGVWRAEESMWWGEEMTEWSPHPPEPPSHAPHAEGRPGEGVDQTQGLTSFPVAVTGLRPQRVLLSDEVILGNLGLNFHFLSSLIICWWYFKVIPKTSPTHILGFINSAKSKARSPVTKQHWDQMNFFCLLICSLTLTLPRLFQKLCLHIWCSNI